MNNIRSKYDIKKFDESVYRLLKGIHKENMKIIIQGGYGKNNLGDDALLITLYRKLKKWFPDCEITAMCHFPEQVERLYSIPAVGFKSIDAFICLAKCDALMIGGGGIVNIINTYSGFRWMRIFDLKGKFLFLSSLFVKARKKKVIFYGVGMTSIPDLCVKRLMKFTLSRVDLIGVRDRISLENARNSIKDFKTLFLTYDPALDYFDDDTPEYEGIKERYGIDSRKKIIIISVRAVPDQQAVKKIISATTDLAKDLGKKYGGLQIILLPVSCHPSKTIENDINICRQIYEKIDMNFPVAFIDSYLQPKIIKKLFGEASLIVMARLHGVILSYDFHVPTIVVSYNEKVRLFAEMAGYPFIFDYYDLNAEELKRCVNEMIGVYCHASHRF